MEFDSAKALSGNVELPGNLVILLGHFMVIYLNMGSFMEQIHFKSPNSLSIHMQFLLCCYFSVPLNCMFQFILVLISKDSDSDSDSISCDSDSDSDSSNSGLGLDSDSA